MLNLTGVQYNICLTKPWTLLSSANGFILFIDSVNLLFVFLFFLFILERFVCLHTNRGLDAVYKCQRFYSLLFLNTVYWVCWPQLWQKPKTVLLKAFYFHPDRSPADHLCTVTSKVHTTTVHSTPKTKYKILFDTKIYKCSCYNMSFYNKQSHGFELLLFIYTRKTLTDDANDLL